MQKLRLNLDEFAVESFKTDEQEGENGTVEGYAGTPRCTISDSAQELLTCVHSCQGSCPCEPIYQTDTGCYNTIETGPFLCSNPAADGVGDGVLRVL